MKQKQHKKKNKKKRGFTIIEVMIVLAIAGLIVVLVFIALSGIQTSRRDTQRRSYANQVSQALESFYEHNHRYPGCTNSCTGTEDALMTRFLTVYLPNSSDPSTGQSYNSTPIVNYGNGKATSNHSVVIYGFNLPHSTAPDVGQVYVAVGHVCYDHHQDTFGGPELSDTAFFGGHTADAYAVVMYQERGQFYCVDNF
jgi:prepilin-type N-terminal cleavage/methylation domain-containing protein